MAKGASQQTITVTNASTLLLEPNPARKAFTVSCPAANRVTLSILNPAVDQQGLVLFALGQTRTFCACHDGNWVKRSIYAIADAGSNPLGVVESFDDEPH